MESKFKKRLRWLVVPVCAVSILLCITWPSASTYWTNTAMNMLVRGYLQVQNDAALNGSVTGDGGDQLTGFLNTVAVKTAEYTPTAGDCGKTFTNEGASGTVTWNLDNVSTAGWHATWVNVAGQEMRIDPAAGDTFVAITNANGDQITNATGGNTVTAEAVTNTKWVITGYYGTWNDGD